MTPRLLAFRVVTTLLCLLGLASLGTSETSCTPGQATTAADVALKVADDVCQEEQNVDAAPDWVQVACKVEQPASGVAHVLLPRTTWDAARGKKAPPCPPCGDGGKPTFPAGPGK